MRKFFENGDYIEYIECTSGYMVSGYSGQIGIMLQEFLQEFNLNYVYIRSDLNYGSQIGASKGDLRIVYKDGTYVANPVDILKRFGCKVLPKGYLITRDGLPYDYIEAPNGLISEKDAHKFYLGVIPAHLYVMAGGLMRELIPSMFDGDLSLTAALDIPTELHYKRKNVGNSVILRDFPFDLAPNQIAEVALKDNCDWYSLIDGATIKYKGKVIESEGDYSREHFFIDGKIVSEDDISIFWDSHMYGSVIVELKDNSLLTLSEYGKKLVQYMLERDFPLQKLNIATVDREIMWINDRPVPILSSIKSIEEALDAYTK
jgi:hypothetical protein